MNQKFIKLLPVLVLTAVMIVLSGCGADEEFINDNDKPLNFDYLPMNYSGKQMRTQYVSADSTCDTEDRSVLAVAENDTVTLTTTGSCVAKTDMCIEQAGDCGYTVTGRLKRSDSTFTFTAGNDGNLKCTGGGRLFERRAELDRIDCQISGDADVILHEVSLGI